MNEHIAEADLTGTLTYSVALELLRQAGFERDHRGRWVQPDGRWTWATDEAVSWALVALADRG